MKKRLKIRITRDRVLALLSGKPFAIAIPAGADVIEFHAAETNPQAKRQLEFLEQLIVRTTN